MQIQKTKFYSQLIGRLPGGCQQCVKGEKLVLFVTGLCPRSCYYCPLSDEKFHKDVIYANERPVSEIEEILEEAKLSAAKGAGITGGDPLSKPERTVSYIEMLKKRFGKMFHIHLYTSFNLVREKSMKKLFDAGLDEIRFHPDIDDEKYWKNISLVLPYSWKKGIEIPIFPDKVEKTKKLIDFFQDKVSFFNFNELEVADNTASTLHRRGFETKNKLSYAVKGSERAAKELMNYILKKKYNVSVHFCTAKLKDKVQLTNRIARRSKNVAKKYDIIDDGLLVRGVVTGKDLKKIKNILIDEFGVPKDLVEVDNKKKRVLTSIAVVHDLKDELKKKGFKPRIVQEYPTWDQLEVDVEFL